MHNLQRQSSDAMTRCVDDKFYREREIRNAVTRRKACDLSGQEIKKIVLMDGTIIDYPERWLKVIDATYEELEGLAVAVKEKYRRRDYKDIITRHGLTKDCYYTTVNEARVFAKCAACQLGLIRVIE